MKNRAYDRARSISLLKWWSAVALAELFFVIGDSAPRMFSINLYPMYKYYAWIGLLIVCYAVLLGCLQLRAFRLLGSPPRTTVWLLATVIYGASHFFIHLCQQVPLLAQLLPSTTTFASLTLVQWLGLPILAAICSLPQGHLVKALVRSPFYWVVAVVLSEFITSLLYQVQALTVDPLVAKATSSHPVLAHLVMNVQISNITRAIVFSIVYSAFTMIVLRTGQSTGSNAT